MMPIRVTYPSVWKLYDWYVLSLKGCQWLMDVKTVDKDSDMRWGRGGSQLTPALCTYIGWERLTFFRRKRSDSRV